MDVEVDSGSSFRFDHNDHHWHWKYPSSRSIYCSTVRLFRTSSIRSDFRTLTALQCWFSPAQRTVMDGCQWSPGKKKALNRNRMATYCLGKIRLYLGKTLFRRQFRTFANGSSNILPWNGLFCILTDMPSNMNSSFLSSFLSHEWLGCKQSFRLSIKKSMKLHQKLYSC